VDGEEDVDGGGGEDIVKMPKEPKRKPGEPRISFPSVPGGFSPS
jgi:hypothetical protein